MKSGPLLGLKVIEFAGIGPGPFCGMFLSDLGADVLRINRKGTTRLSGLSGTQYEFDARGRSAVALDLKSAAAIGTCLDLIGKAGGGVVEGYPQDLPQGKRISAKFLYNVTRSLYEQTGFSYDRPKGKNHCVMRTTVAPAGARRRARSG